MYRERAPAKQHNHDCQPHDVRSTTNVPKARWHTSFSKLTIRKLTSRPEGTSGILVHNRLSCHG